MSDETPPKGIVRPFKRRAMKSVQARNQQPDTGPNPAFRFQDSSNAPRETEVDTDPTAAGGIERTLNTGRNEGLIKPTLKLRVIKGGKED